MKVLFTLGALPHYFKALLDKLSLVPGMEIYVVIPEGKSKNVGKGVYQEKASSRFNIIELPEYRAWYGKVYFKGFNEKLLEIKPDIYVTNWPYVLQLATNYFLLRKIRKAGIKIIYRDIPFNLPKKQEARKYYRSHQFQLESDAPVAKKKFTDVFKYEFLIQLVRRYMKIADAHMYYAETAYEIAPTYGVPNEKIFITYNSPDTDPLLAINEKLSQSGQEPIRPHNPHRLLHVGRLVKWKRVDMLLEVFALLLQRFPHAELVIIGNGPEESALKDEVTRLNIKSSVHFAGAIYDTETLGRFFKCSSAYVLSGMGGLSINEAMCFGKPVVCSVADGTEKSLVKDHYNGLYFENNNPEDLYRKLAYLLEHQELIQEFGKNSLDIIKNKININTVLERYIHAFNYVCPDKKITFPK